MAIMYGVDAMEREIAIKSGEREREWQEEIVNLGRREMGLCLLKRDFYI